MLLFIPPLPHPPPFLSSRSHMMQVVLGEHSIVKVEGFEQRFNVSLVIRHYQYRHWSFDNDIMLIKVMDDGDTDTMTKLILSEGSSNYTNQA